ncbi:MAG: bifunctional 5,10-methylenetetrahydrofolate dehydrogenase/5,10-methenyltetrahydrofolate cyclohydrolase [Patescibacteria group bacterium]
MIIDGKALARRRIQELRVERTAYGPLTLALIVSSSDAVTKSYISIKRRIARELDVSVVEYATFDEVVHADGIILQLPLPTSVNVDSERNRIVDFKDVDILGDAAYAKFVTGEYPPPPVARALRTILQNYKIDVAKKTIAVVGHGRLVGLPSAELFQQLGSQVSVVEKGGDVQAAVKDADIIVMGAGTPGLLTPNMIKDGVIILDAGTSESSGRVVGDADPACAHKASLFTPVPGGVGPVAVTEIFANLFDLKSKT